MDAGVCVRPAAVPHPERWSFEPGGWVQEAAHDRSSGSVVVLDQVQDGGTSTYRLHFLDRDGALTGTRTVEHYCGGSLVAWRGRAFLHCSRVLRVFSLPSGEELPSHELPADPWVRGSLFEDRTFDRVVYERGGEDPAQFLVTGDGVDGGAEWFHSEDPDPERPGPPDLVARTGETERWRRVDAGWLVSVEQDALVTIDGWALAIRSPSDGSLRELYPTPTECLKDPCPGCAARPSREGQGYSCYGHLVRTAAGNGARYFLYEQSSGFDDPNGHELFVAIQGDSGWRLESLRRITGSANDADGNESLDVSAEGVVARASSSGMTTSWPPTVTASFGRDLERKWVCESAADLRAWESALVPGDGFLGVSFTRVAWLELRPLEP